jgi:predicted nucleic acid-binding protein
VWLTEALYNLCTASLQNRNLCCSSGLLTDIVSALRCHDRLQRPSADHLLRLLETLGQHSITAAELKLFLQLLQQQQQDWEQEQQLEQFPYKSQIIHIISSIARGDGFQHSRQYFDIQERTQKQLPISYFVRISCCS